MTERCRQGWPALSVPLVVIAGLSVLSGPPHCRADDPPSVAPGAPPPPQSSDRSDPDAANPFVSNAPRPPAADSEEAMLLDEAHGNAADVARLAEVRISLNPLLIRDRRHRLLLKRGRDALHAGEAVEAIGHLQALLDAPQDAFFWTIDSPSPFGAQSSAVRRLSDLTASDRQTYERLHGAAATQLLDRYEETYDRRVLFELMRRFGHTAAGRRAAVHELLVAVDCGRRALADEWARVLIADIDHWRRLPTGIRERATDAISQQAAASAAGGTNRDEEVSPPFPAPLWSVRFDAPASTARGEPPRTASGPATDLTRSLHDWIADRMERRIPIATANQALLAAGTLIVRDFERVRAYELSTGRPLWSYPCGISLAAHAAATLDSEGSKSSSAATEFDALVACNPVLGRLAADSSRVFVLDRVPTPAHANGQPSAREGTALGSTAAASVRPNQLAALPLQLQEPARDVRDGVETCNKPLWTRGAWSGTPKDCLRDHVFLGCPLPVDDRVFVLTEFDRQISLWALDAATGQTLWHQHVALVTQSLSSDALRTCLACSPVYWEGVVACPTEVGIVVGVDALTGRLLWAYDHLDEDQRSASARWTFSSVSRGDRQPITGQAVVQSGRLLYLPGRSSFLHCIDLQTGTGWTSPRGDSYAIAAVTDSLVLLLGDRECRAVDLQNRQDVWRTAIEDPAGLGVVAGDRYLLPTSNGPCLTIDLKSGRISGRSFGRVLYEVVQQSIRNSPDAAAEESVVAEDQLAAVVRTLRSAPAGNLIAERGLIVATTPVGVAVFAQSGPALQRLMTRGDALSDDDLLRLGQLQLTLGDAAAAEATLEKLLPRPLDANVRTAAERLLAEMLYARLDHSSEPRVILTRLARLQHGDEQQMRRLLRQIDAALRCEDSGLLVAGIEEFQSRPDVGLQALDEKAYLTSPRQYVWERLSRLRQDGPAELRAAVLVEISRQAAELRNVEDVERLEQFVTLFAGWEPADPVRLRLASQWIAAGRRQEAELLLLSDRLGHNAKSESASQLAELYSREGLRTLPTNRLAVDASSGDRIRASSPDPSLPVGTALVSLRSDSGAGRLHRAAFGPPPPPPEVSIVEHICRDDCEQQDACRCRRVREWHRSSRRRFIPRRTGNLMVLDRGPIGPDKSESRLLIADRDKGLVRGEITVPAAYWQTPPPLTAETGHVMVIGGESAFGLSLLEGKLLWTVQPNRSGRRPDKFKLGPIGSDFCVLQTSRELRVVHPATGQTLWVRSEIPPGIGLDGHDAVGIIGDSETLAVFDSDQTAYTLYHTQSGRWLSRETRTQAADSGRRQRWAVGRRLVEQVAQMSGARLIIWDSRSNSIELDVPIMNRLSCPLPNGAEFALLTQDGRLQIANVSEGRLRVNLPLESSLGPQALEDVRRADRLTCFSDHRNDYVSFHRDAEGNDSGPTAAEEQLAFPSVRVGGRLVAIDRSTQGVVWERTITDASIPFRPDGLSPVLVLVRQRRDAATQRSRGAKDSTQRLLIEVLDTATGQTLASRDDLHFAQFVDFPVPAFRAATDEAAAIRLSLLGLHSCVDITCLPHAPGRGLQVASDAETTLDR